MFGLGPLPPLGGKVGPLFGLWNWGVDCWVLLPSASTGILVPLKPDSCLGEWGDGTWVRVRVTEVRVRVSPYLKAQPHELLMASRLFFHGVSLWLVWSG